MSNGYALGFWLVGATVFLLTWAYCALTYGFLFGFGFGWVPSLIVGGVAGLAWPLVAFAALIVVIYARG